MNPAATIVAAGSFCGFGVSNASASSSRGQRGCSANDGRWGVLAGSSAARRRAHL